MRSKWLFFLGLNFLAVNSPMLHGQGIGWALVNAKIHGEFPNVPRIQTGQLADWLNDSTRNKPLLLDVRTEPEFAVSHLSGAKRIEPGADVKAVRVPRDQPIVTYCSVGYRSAAFAQKLRDAGFTHVSNLEGSIFRWANENRPLVRDGRAANKVHPYNSFWGRLLKAPLRARLPEQGEGASR